MKWNKLGLLWTPRKQHWWSKKYGMLPVPLVLNDRIRVFIGTADEHIDSRVTYIDLDLQDPTKIIYEHNVPVLDIGNIGTYDDSGVVPSSILEVNNKLFLYTVGFQRCEKVPYMLYAGLAVSEDMGNSFYRLHESPILPRNNFRPTSQGAPSVLFDNGIYKMWHWFSTKWIKVSGKLFLDYQIGYAESTDGINWEMREQPCLVPDESLGEFAVARPWVVKENNLFKMWFSKRIKGKMYRIGYAESTDGISWIRKDEELNFDVSQFGWDSEMVCYPAIFNANGNTYMLYNGNNNGAEGFGIAQLIEE